VVEFEIHERTVERLQAYNVDLEAAVGKAQEDLGLLALSLMD